MPSHGDRISRKRVYHFHTTLATRAPGTARPRLAFLYPGAEGAEGRANPCFPRSFFLGQASLEPGLAAAPAAQANLRLVGSGVTDLEAQN